MGFAECPDSAVKFLENNNLLSKLARDKSKHIETYAKKSRKIEGINLESCSVNNQYPKDDQIPADAVNS